MNTKQLKTLWISIGIIVVMLLFPPWQYRSKTRTVSGPYRFIFLGAPEVPVTSIESKGYIDPVEFFKGRSRSMWTPKVDWVRLALPFVIVVIISAGLMVTFRSRE